jgi:hypothetical protein
MDGIQVDQDWAALVGMVTNTTEGQRISLLLEHLLPCQSGPCVYFGPRLLLNENAALSLANLKGCCHVLSLAI